MDRKARKNWRRWELELPVVSFCTSPERGISHIDSVVVACISNSVNTVWVEYKLHFYTCESSWITANSAERCLQCNRLVSVM